jgi:hypothetical protein
MGGTYRQQRDRQNKTGLTLFVAFAIVVWPVGQPMPVVPGSKAAQTETMAPVNYAAMFGACTEDDLEVEHHDFTIVHEPVRELVTGNVDWLISFLWTERLHRPPISAV